MQASRRESSSGFDLLIRNAAVWATPDAQPVLGCDVLVERGTIVAVDPSVRRVGDGVPVLNAGGCILTAGYWNCHIHLTERAWAGARHTNPARLQHALDDMLVSRGFTSAADLASNPRDTLPLIARIASGELTGPTIHTATTAIYPARGLPFYVKDAIPRHLRWALSTRARLQVHDEQRGAAFAKAPA